MYYRLNMHIIFMFLLQSARSVNARNKNSVRRRRGSTKSVSVSLKSKKGSSVLVSRRLKTESAVVRRRERVHKRREPRYELFCLFYLFFFYNSQSE